MISTSVVVDDDHFKDENHSYSLLSNSLENIYPEEAVQYWTSAPCIFHSRAYAGGWESIMESFAQILYLFLDYSSLDHQKMLKLWKWCLGNTELRTPQIWEKYRICECVNSRMPPGNKQIYYLEAKRACVNISHFDNNTNQTQTFQFTCKQMKSFPLQMLLCNALPRSNQSLPKQHFCDAP